MWRMLSILGVLAGCAGQESPIVARAQVVGRLQGTEFPVPTEAAAVWLDASPVAALRLSEAADGCNQPSGWSVIVQVEPAQDGGTRYAIGPRGHAPGTGFLSEYRRDPQSPPEVPSEATGELRLTYVTPEIVAGSLQIDSGDGAMLAALFSAGVCQGTALLQ